MGNNSPIDNNNRIILDIELHTVRFLPYHVSTTFSPSNLTSLNGGRKSSHERECYQ
jgi:hypothetical protein